MSNVLTLIDFGQVRQKLENILESIGFECHPFKVGWYNERVRKQFRLNLPDDTLAFIIISTPFMFEKAFKPFIQRIDCCSTKLDLIDQCMKEQFELVKQEFSGYNIECYHDFELDHSRRPRILVQTAGHAAGAAYYYQRLDVQNDPWSSETKIFGVSIHPKYSGWFAFRGAIVFSDILIPDLPQVHPRDVVGDDTRKIELLERFNFHWRDWTFRDVVQSEAQYSEEQKLYFETHPKDRIELVSKMKENV